MSHIILSSFFYVKMLLSFKILPHLLVMPPRRGIKESRPSATRVLTQTFFDTKVKFKLVIKIEIMWFICHYRTI